MIFIGTTIWLVALVALVLWLPQNAQHEAAHCALHKWYGAEILSFKPWPTWEGHFRFASMSYRQPKDKPLTGPQEALCSAAPLLLNTTILIAAGLLRWALDGTGAASPVLLSILAGWALVNYVDGAVWLGTYYRSKPKPSTDGWKVQRALDIDVDSCRAMAVAWHLGFGVYLLLPWLPIW